MQAARPGHSFETLVEQWAPEGETLETARPGHSFETLVELSTKSQALQVVWKNHLIKLFVEMHTENQDFQAFREAIRRWDRGAPSYPCHPPPTQTFSQRLGILGGISKLRIGLLEPKCRIVLQSSLQCLALAMFDGASAVKLGGRGPALPLSWSGVVRRPSCALPGPEWKD